MQYISSIYNLSLEELTTYLTSWDEPGYRADQIWKGLYQQFWSSPEEFTTLPKVLRMKLCESFIGNANQVDAKQFFTCLNPVNTQISTDGKTIKTLFSLKDDQQIEAVLMRYNNRRTICISTQVGCAMGCVFCGTGQMGFSRQLTSGEIVEQVIYYARQLAREHEQVTNIVVMGMGEPFHNYEETISAIKRLNDPEGFNLGARRFTISTVGLVPGIRRFTRDHSQVNLAISLHAADDSLRSQLLPINRKYNLEQLFSACQEYIQITHRRLSIEWALIQGVNDTQEQANMLLQRIKLLHGAGSLRCHVNLIPLNPTNKYAGNATTQKSALAFQKILERAGIPSTIRLRRGIEIQAGCGQLAGNIS